MLEFYTGILCLTYSFWITLDYSVLDSDFMFIWIYLQNLGSETAERLVLINILRDSLDIKGIVN